MTAAFLGVTAHFYAASKDKMRHNVTIAARRFPSPHTAANVADLVNNVLAEWNIPHTMVHRIITDNGSNMIAAFKQHQLGDENPDNAADADFEEMEVDLVEDEDDKEADEVEDDSEDTLSQEEVQDFEECEHNHIAAFAGFQRTSCFSHMLQLVVKEFDNRKSQKRVLSRVHKLVSKVNKSCKATEMLISKAGKKLIADCPTRWSSAYLMLSRLLSVREELVSVLDELQWDNLPTSYWKQIENTVELLQPFAIYTQLVGSEEVTTISMIIPILAELHLHLEQLKNSPGFVDTVRLMQLKLREQFDYITNPRATNFDPLFTICTFLNPEYKDILNKDQELVCHNSTDYMDDIFLSRSCGTSATKSINGAKCYR